MHHGGHFPEPACISFAESLNRELRTHRWVVHCHFKVGPANMPAQYWRTDLGLGAELVYLKEQAVDQRLTGPLSTHVLQVSSRKSSILHTS